MTIRSCARSMILALALAGATPAALAVDFFHKDSEVSFNPFTQKVAVFEWRTRSLLEVTFVFSNKAVVRATFEDPIFSPPPPEMSLRGYGSVEIAFSDGSTLKISAIEFKPPAAVATARAQPAASAAIRVSNDADTFASSCDGRFSVVVGANSATPVSLVDLASEKEVATAAYPGKLARAVAVGDDNQSVLVALDNTTNSDGNAIRRLTIGAGNTLVDAGEQLAFGSDFVRKVEIAPGSRIGVALVGQFPARLVAFTVPGLAARGSVTLAQGIGSAIVFNRAGDRVYARSGRRGIGPDVIQSFTFDPVTGAIGQSAALTIDNVAGFTGTAFHDPMALSRDGARIIVAEEAPASRIRSFNPATGAVVGTRADTSTANPQIVGTGKRCPGSTIENLVEYHHAAFDHYFVTGIGDEIAKLDDGTFAGWARTGHQVDAYSPGTSGTAATCRFFSTAFGAKSSHFYTPIASECATVKANPSWQFEAEVFNLVLTTDGTCAAPTIPLYRLYNSGQGGAPNHRYTTSLDTRAQMIAVGWVPEGTGVGVVGCVFGSAPL